ncbi:MAG: DUF2927 domain-containing protein [Rhizobiales bacterium]|nr:DUF2927 domain-containing protein [Hyphomicrobiales bacterium]
MKPLKDDGPARLTNIASGFSVERRWRRAAFLFTVCLFVVGLFAFSQATGALADDPANHSGVDRKMVTKDFLNTIFTSEFGSRRPESKMVKKYTVPVRFAIINHAKKQRSGEVKSFLKQLSRKINGLDAALANSTEEANFKIHIVDRDQYRGVVQKMYGRTNVPVRGTCFSYMRVNANGIEHTEVALLSDRSDAIFNRCLIEEVLQGLGPISDNGTPEYSIFNTKTTKASFTMHDQVLMNALYDPRIKAGMKKGDVAGLLPAVIDDCIARMPSS